MKAATFVPSITRIQVDFHGANQSNWPFDCETLKVR